MTTTKTKTKTRATAKTTPKKRRSRNSKARRSRDSAEDITKYAPLVQSIAAHYAPDLLSQEELESLAWEGALRAFRTYDSKKGTALKSWIFTKANGAIKDALRKEQSRREHEAQGSVSFFEACLADRNADNSEADSYCKKIVQDALETLDGRTREIIRRRFFDGETQAKIAASVGISQSWCSRLYKRGMEQLKNEILRLNTR